MRDRKFIDLSFPIHENMLTYPRHWHPVVQMTRLGRHKTEGRETRKIVIGTHTGTHMDAPLHFIPEGNSIDAVSLDICIGSAFIVHCTKKTILTAKDLANALGSRKNIERLIVHFGWSRHWGTTRYYERYPYFSEDAFNWIMDRNIKLVGMDTPSPDNPDEGYGSTRDSPLHKLFLKNNIVLVEYLCNLNKLKGPRIFLTALPLKLKGADGSPARVVAREY